MSETGRSAKDRAFPYIDGAAQFHDMPITAALLSLSGAAWDGQRPVRYPPAAKAGSREAEAWEVRTNRADVRVIHIEHVGDHMAEVLTKVTKAGGWKGHAPGEMAIMDKVHYHLKAMYRYFRDGRLTREVAWTYEDFEFWRKQIHRQGGVFVVPPTGPTKWRNYLLDINRRKYKKTSQLSAHVGG